MWMAPARGAHDTAACQPEATPGLDKPAVKPGCAGALFMHMPCTIAITYPLYA